jgi:two-component system, chemotaxis family, protein-glutamate methylesterase/glutaminase
VYSQLIVMGGSLGGLRALSTIFQALIPAFPLPIAVAQHRHPDSSPMLSEVLQRSTRLTIRDAEDKDEITPGCIYLAPANYHLLVEQHHFVLSTDEPVSFARPSVDVLFESAADAYGKGTIAVILTGANQDGAAGAVRVKQRGGQVIVQNPTEAESPFMPQAVLDRIQPDAVLPMREIANRLNQICVMQR